MSGSTPYAQLGLNELESEINSWYGLQIYILIHQSNSPTTSPLYPKLYLKSILCKLYLNKIGVDSSFAYIYLLRDRSITKRFMENLQALCLIMAATSFQWNLSVQLFSWHCFEFYWIKLPRGPNYLAGAVMNLQHKLYNR